MALKYHLFVILLFKILSHEIVAAQDGEMFDFIMEKINNLEVNDIANKLEISSLKVQISDMKNEFEQKQERLTEDLRAVKSRLSAYEEADKEEVNQPFENVVSMEADLTETTKARRQAQQQPEVAFYATHSEHDVTNLQANEILLFEQDVTNIGNAYSTLTGTFTAPVSGTYVFHVTIMGGLAHNTTHNHYSAMIDVNGEKYSKMWVTIHDQSSQMLVIDVDKGGVVTIRNINPDEGFVGQHYSTFSGFLLYPKSESPASIIGK